MEQPFKKNGTNNSTDENKVKNIKTQSNYMEIMAWFAAGGVSHFEYIAVNFGKSN